MARDTPVSVIAGIAANLAVAVVKFVAAGLTGSAAMTAEAVHSLVDTGNGGLLLLGKRLSNQPPDERHPFGYGKDLYFWTLVVAMSLFGVGGGVTVVEGVERVLDPGEPGSPFWNYAVLGASALFESASFAIAYRQVDRDRDGRTLWETIRASKDPTDFFVLLEDGAGLIGIAIAFLGVLLSTRFGMPAMDGVASVLIGLLLAALAVFLASECRTLLLGESVNRQVAASISALARADPAVESASAPMTMHLGPADVLLNLDLKFRGGVSGADLVGAIDRLERAIREKHPEITRVYLHVDSLGARDPHEAAAR